jgi:hypothetical protein
MKKFVTAFLLLSLCGCSMAQLRQEFVGLSIADVKNSKFRQTQQYDISADKCLKIIRETLTGMKAIVREDDKNSFILADNLSKAFRPCIDTTQVGILVTAWNPEKSQVDVASENRDLAAFVSKKICDKIKPAPQKEDKPAEEKKKEGVAL